MANAPRFRIELTRKEGWALLDLLSRATRIQGPNQDDLVSICEKVRTRMNVNQEKYGER